MATQALQFVFQGFSGFRWPVAYFGSDTAKAYELNELFLEAVDVLDDHGFSIQYVLMDGASTNRAFTNIVFGGLSPIASSYTVRNIFVPNGYITIIQDIKHVLKKIRNNIESSKKAHNGAPGRYLVLEDNEVIWEHFSAAYGFNVHAGLRYHPRLTKDHIELTPASKMRNHLATDVLGEDMLHLMERYGMSEKEDLPKDIPKYDVSSTIALLSQTS